MEKASDPPLGQFNLTEVSPGVYKIEATDARGRGFEASGTDRDELIRRAKAYLLELGSVRKRAIR